MNILGIETSCDETSASVVKNGRTLLSNVVASSLSDHQKYGGIIPEIASRRQLEFITIVTMKALSSAGLKLTDIDAIAYTKKPGLIGSLLVGISFANSLSFALNKPLIPVNHIHAHIYANFLVDKAKDKGQDLFSELPLPAIGLVVSGGHSSLFSIKNFQSFRVFGQTRDDAAGEAYDKVARILDLGYPGGPVIDKLSRTVKDNDIRFLCAPLAGTNDFSFSGIKTAVLYYKQKHGAKKDFSIPRVAHAFQEGVVNILVEKSLLACQKRKAKTLLVGGGVAANTILRSRLEARGREVGIRVSFPAMSLCMDNAAMVAGLAYHCQRPSVKNAVLC
ncbi:MAG: tRNA (adenosine(37)-N6)-threonylcarbamoyltransferase complex transferase subunit TsaD [Candidatus Omnitrophica bacterium]|nr:tRNA (adenosine(37)-N6)-threonylcarbamoyltransferase complex transferase subunit TsaD [Candidatus Omnitrophota bacterium]